MQYNLTQKCFRMTVIFFSKSTLINYVNMYHLIQHNLKWFFWPLFYHAQGPAADLVGWCFVNNRQIIIRINLLTAFLFLPVSSSLSSDVTYIFSPLHFTRSLELVNSSVITQSWPYLAQIDPLPTFLPPCVVTMTTITSNVALKTIFLCPFLLYHLGSLWFCWIV